MNRFLRYPLQQEAGEEQKSAAGDLPKTYTAAEVDELVAGLKANNAALLAEKKESGRLAKEAEEARQREHQESLKTAGKMDEFEKTIRSQYEPVLKEKEERYSVLAGRVLGSERKSVINGLQPKFRDDCQAEAAEIAAMMVRTEFDGDNVVTKFVGADGNVITTDAEQFVDYLRKHKAFSHLMKANAASGGGAAGGKGGGAAKTASEMTGDERAALLRENPNEFYRLFPGLRKK